MKKPIKILYVSSIFLIVLGFILLDSVSSIEMQDSQCKPDCTTYADTCMMECDNVNNCSYPVPHEFVSWRGLTVKEECHLQKRGWVKFFNSTHDVVCCDNAPFLRHKKVALEIKYDSGIEDISTISRMVNLNGRMVRMYISVWK